MRVFRKKKVVTEEDVKNFIDDYSSGMTCKAVGEKYGVHETTVLKHLKKNGVEIRKNKVYIDVAAYTFCYENGMTTAEIGKKHGVSTSTVYRALKADGVIESQNEPTKADIQYFIDESISGASAVEISRKCDFSSTTVIKYLKSAGFDTSSQINQPTPQDKINKFVEEYTRGITIESIASRYDVSRRTVSKHLRQSNIDTHGYTYNYGRIYCIFCDGIPWYIGQTQKGVEARLKEHITTNSTIGKLVYSNPSLKDRLTIDVVEDNIPTRKLNKKETRYIKFYATSYTLVNYQHNR